MTRCGARSIRCTIGKRIEPEAVRYRDFGPTSCIRTAPRRACWDAWPPPQSACRPSCIRCTAHRFIPINRGGAGVLSLVRKVRRATSTAIISVADAMTDQLVAAGVAPREKFTTIYSGMEVEPFLDADAHRDALRAELGY